MVALAFSLTSLKKEPGHVAQWVKRLPEESDQSQEETMVPQRNCLRMVLVDYCCRQ